VIELNGKIALVTGAASGIGRGISAVLAKQGATVIVADIDLSGARSVSDEISNSGSKSESIHLDVTSRDSSESVVSYAATRFGQIDILVNNAGVVGADGWWNRRIPSDKDWAAVMDINLLGVVFVSQAVEPGMVENHSGKIINIASTSARQGSQGIPHYNASKAAVVNWTKSHALQLAPYQVNVNAICPGLLWTPLFEHLNERPGFVNDVALQGLTGRTRFEKKVQQLIPMKKEQTPDDIGKLTAFLASEDSQNITGQSINVNGGLIMN